MSVSVETIDRWELPDAMLALTKSHLRVDHSGDDQYIRETIKRAIGRIEATHGVTINPTTVFWTPSAAAFVQGAAMLPAIVAHDFTADAGGDVTADYSIVLKWDDIHGVPIQRLVGAAASGLAITLELGFDDETLPPQLQDQILRHAAHLFEHREILLPGSAYVAPDLMMDATWWMPKL